METKKEKAEANYSYLGLLLIALLSWGVVPGFAKLGNLAGDVTTFYVNWVAVLAVVGIITVNKHWHKFKQYTLKQYLTMVALGITWPLVYSVAYFQTVQTAGPTLATILNYTWPLFTLIFAYLISKKSANKLSVLAVVLSAIAVGLTCYLDNHLGIGISLGALVLGLIAAATQGFYSAATDKWQFDPWIMTLVVEVVTAIGVSFLVIARGSFVIPTAETFAYLAVIGAISNGIGFWAFLAGSQLSAKNMQSKTTWLIGMCFVPFMQVFLVVIMGAEKVSLWKWTGVAVIGVSLLLNRFAPYLQKVKVKDQQSRLGLK